MENRTIDKLLSDINDTCIYLRDFQKHSSGDGKIVYETCLTHFEELLVDYSYGKINNEELRCNQIFQLLHFSNLTLRDILMLSDSERTILTKLFIDKYWGNRT